MGPLARTAIPTSIPVATPPHASARGAARAVPAAPLLGGAIAASGALLAAGAALPWLTLFAGLQRYSGLAGLNGRLLLAAGLATFVLAGIAAWRAPGWVTAVCGALGAALTGFVAWLLVGLFQMVGTHAANPMMIARVGPGLFVALAGALLLAAIPLAAIPLAAMRTLRRDPRRT